MILDTGGNNYKHILYTQGLYLHVIMVKLQLVEMDALRQQKFVLIILIQSAISTYGIILVPDNLVLIIEVSLIQGVC